MDRVRASELSATDLDDIPVPRQDAVDVDNQRDVRVCCRVPEAQTVRLERVVALKRTLPIGGCDWDNVDVMDYVRQGEHLD